MWETAFKNLKGYDQPEGGHITSNFLKAVFHKFSLVYSWILSPVYVYILFITLKMHLGIISKLRFKYETNLATSINFYSPWNHQKAIGFLIISRRMEVNKFSYICFKLESKFGDNPFPAGIGTVSISARQWYV